MAPDAPDAPSAFDAPGAVDVPGDVDAASAPIVYTIGQVVAVNFPGNGDLYPCHVEYVHPNNTVNVKGFDSSTKKLAWVVLKLGCDHLLDPILMIQPHVTLWHAIQMFLGMKKRQKKLK